METEIKEPVTASIRCDFSPQKAGRPTLAAVTENGACSQTLYNALMRPWPKGEGIIATAIGVKKKRSGRPAILPFAEAV